MEQVVVVRIPTPGSTLGTVVSHPEGPKVGDLGTVVDVQSRSGEPPIYTVEAFDMNGQTKWLAIFDEIDLDACNS